MRGCRFFAAMALLVPAALAGQTTEIGELDGAAYRIDIPENWNHRLVIFYHGYSAKPVTFKAGPPGKIAAPFVAHGYAWIQTGYSVTGWALAQAFPETEALRAYFISKYGKPAKTYVTGQSMGGALTVMTIEKAPEYYDGALALCGRLDPSNAARQRAFAMRAAFDYYFPGRLPPLDPVPQNFENTPALRREVEEELARHPAGAAAMRALLELHSDRDVANKMVFATYVVKDVQEKAGGNPFDNRNYIYTGTSDDRALNDGVKRYAGDPRAQQFLVQYYTPTGRLLRPMLALATTYDPLTNPSRVTAWYENAVETEGRAENYLQQYVQADGHCNFTPGQIWTAFSELVDWANGGARPAPGLLPEGEAR